MTRGLSLIIKGYSIEGSRCMAYVKQRRLPGSYLRTTFRGNGGNTTQRIRAKLIAVVDVFSLRYIRQEIFLERSKGPNALNENVFENIGQFFFVHFKKWP